MNFTTTAPDRKTLVKAIAEHFELDPAYNGPPTFSYSVGDITVDRDGMVAIEDEKTAARLQAFLIEKGWMESAPEAPAEPDLEEPVLNIGFPLTSMTVLSLTNLVHMLYSKQYILAKSVREQRITITAQVISELHERNPQTVEEFCTLIRELTAQQHIRGITVSDEAVSLAFPLTEDDTTRATFQQLGVRIFHAAMNAKRVQAEYQEPEAEKYHMRGWLLRLGFGGPANAEARKALLGHLAGCAAFPNAEQAKRHADKYAAIRREQREAARAAAEAPVAAPAPIQEPVEEEKILPGVRPVKPHAKEVSELE